MKKENKPSIYVDGYALLFGERYSMGNDYIEIISPRAFQNGVDMTDVRFLRDHVATCLLGRTKSGSLKLTVDRIGLHFRCRLPNTALGKETANLIQRGDLTQMSWGFSCNPGGSEWTTGTNGEVIRTIVSVNQVLDVSAVTYAANPKTWIKIAEGTTQRDQMVDGIETAQNFLNLSRMENIELHQRAGNGAMPAYECADLSTLKNEARQATLAEAKAIRGNNSTLAAFDTDNEMADIRAAEWWLESQREIAITEKALDDLRAYNSGKAWRDFVSADLRKVEKELGLPAGYYK